MKKAIPLIILLTVAAFPTGLQNKGLATGTTLANARPQSVSLDSSQVIDPSRTDEDDFFYDPEIISRKLFQKKLPALPNHQKIIWSFRLAEGDLFL